MSTSDARKPVVVFSGPRHCHDIVNHNLGERFDIRFVEPNPDSLLPVFRECNAFLDASMKVPLSAKDINDARDLQLVVTATTGATHIDREALDQRGVPLLTLKGQRDLLRELTPAAELTWALIMACARHLRGALDHVQSGEWDRQRFPGVMLKGRTIGIVGLGRIGSWVARYADAFGMRVCYYDPNVEDAPGYAYPLSLHDLVQSSDVITVHVHVNADTAGMVDARLISKFKRGAIFVNTSRGELVDESALVAQLEKGHLAAIGVDVLGNEPDIHHNPLWRCSKDHPNVLITPHIGGFCPDALERVVAFSSGRIREFFSNQ